jgi:hypothetical protein
MSKFLYLWEQVPGTLPADPRQRGEILGKMIEMTKKALDDRRISDWGLFAGGDAGYCIGEGTEADALRGAMQFTPYYKFTVHPVLSLQQVAEVMKSISG